MNLLIAPAHYLFTDKVGSEPLWAVELVRALSSRVKRLDVIVGIADCEFDLPENVIVHKIFSSRSKHASVEFLKKILFYFLVTIKGLILLKQNKYSAVHHLLPFSLSSFNPLILICHWLFPEVKTVIGPVQMPYPNDHHDLDIVLIGKKSTSLLIRPIEILVALISQAMLIPTQHLLVKADCLICTSEVTKKYYEKYRTGCIKVIPPLIRLPNAGRKTVENPVKNSMWELLFVGSLTPRKGVKDLLQAFYKITTYRKDVYLILVGGGPEESSLRELSCHLGISDMVTFSGNIPRNRIAKYYRSANILCVPSLEDSYPTVIVEGLSAGLPIVATDTGSIREMVGDAGFVSAKGDFGKIAENIGRIISDPAVYAKLRRNSTRRFTEMFSEKKIIDSYIKIFT